MKIDMNYRFKDLDGNDIPDIVPVIDENGHQKRDKNDMLMTKEGKPITLRSICVRALLNPPMKEDPRTGRMVPAMNIPAEKKVELYDLALHIHKGESLVDLAVEEITLLKELIGAKFPPLTVGQAFRILDPTAKRH